MTTIKKKALELFPDKTTPGWNDHWNHTNREKFIQGAEFILPALKRYEDTFQKLFETKFGKENEKLLKIWFVFASKEAKKLLQ